MIKNMEYDINNVAKEFDELGELAKVKEPAIDLIYVPSVDFDLAGINDFDPPTSSLRNNDLSMSVTD